MNRKQRRSARRKGRRGFQARPPARLLEFIGPDQWAFMERISADMGAFEYEVLGLAEASVATMLLGAHISTLLWDQHGPKAQWSHLDVDAVLDLWGSVPAEFHAMLFTSLMGLVTWLANNGRLQAPQAQTMLARLALREPPEVAEMRRAFAQLPNSEHARMEHRRLERVAELRERKGRVN